ncbi:MAG TPA: hypothetical protein VNB89_10860 [Gemmatimonadaceae bacterium]|jgi:hypothetical protein|nr:hypothetical protein [Gemmatimonadaceae bacterium]
MPGYDEVEQPEVGSFEIDGQTIEVRMRIIFDGVEHVGRLWFAEEGWDDDGIPDRAAFPGRTKDEVFALAKRLYPHEFVSRYRRAQAEKRRFHSLRKLTDDILAKIRFLNQVGLSMRAGLLDMEGAAQELELTERQLHDLVDRLRPAAGVEE